MAYTSLNQKSTGLGGTIFAKPAFMTTRLVRLVRSVFRRRHLATLNAMNAQQLADIGLRRDDIHQSAALGMSEDVTLHLARLVRQRRNADYHSGKGRN